MRYARNVCHHCHGTETDPRRLIRIAFPFSPLRRAGRLAAKSGSESRAPGHERLGPHYTLTTHVTHVACFLEAGGAIADLSDSQLWHVPTRLWQRLGYLPGDSMAEYLLVQIEERDAARRAAGSAALLSVIPSEGVARSATPQSRDLFLLPLAKKGPSTALRSARDDGRARRPATRELRRAA